MAGEVRRKGTMRLEPSTVRAVSALAENWAAVENARKAAGLSDDSVPEDAFTADKYAEMCGVARFTADRELRKMARLGLMKHGRKRTVAADGKYRLLDHFWVTEQ